MTVLKKGPKILKLTEQQLDDLASAVSFTLRDYPKEGAKNFLAALTRLNKKIWKEIRGY